MITLGSKVTDRVTGFSGIATGRAGMIIVIPDSAFEPAPCGFLRYSFRDTPDATATIFFDPQNDETCANVILFKIKLLCERRNWRLVGVGAMNQFPLFSLLCDEVLLRDDPTALGRIYEPDGPTACYTPLNELAPELVRNGWIQRSTWTRDFEHAALMDGNATPIYSRWLEEAAAVPNEAVVERFAEPTVYVRQSSIDLFRSLSLPKDVLVCEFKDDGAYSRETAEVVRSLGLPTIGLDREFQRTLLRKAGSHYMSVQLLASLFNNWMFGCLWGSANIFCLLPVKALFLGETYIFSSQSVMSCLRSLYVARYGDIGRTVPALLVTPIDESLKERAEEVISGFRHFTSP